MSGSPLGPNSPGPTQRLPSPAFSTPRQSSTPLPPHRRPSPSTPYFTPDSSASSDYISFGPDDTSFSRHGAGGRWSGSGGWRSSPGGRGGQHGGWGGGRGRGGQGGGAYHTPRGTPWRSHQSRHNCGQDDISLYFHPSMLDDPWADLERRAARSQTEEPKVGQGTSDAECDKTVADGVKTEDSASGSVMVTQNQ